MVGETTDFGFDWVDEARSPIRIPFSLEARSAIYTIGGGGRWTACTARAWTTSIIPAQHARGMGGEFLLRHAREGTSQLAGLAFDSEVLF